MTSDETIQQVARTWHAGSGHAADGMPFGGPLCNCQRVAGRIMPMLRDAWEDAVEMAADKGWLHVDAVADTSDRNPYRAEEGRHVDQ